MATVNCLIKGIRVERDAPVYFEYLSLHEVLIEDNSTKCPICNEKLKQ